MPPDCTLAEGGFDALAEQGVFSAASIGAGAIATFTGVARAAAINGAAVEALYLDHHPIMTLASLEAIAAAARARFEIDRLRIVHRCGRVAAGEPIVFVAAAAAHRRAAIEAVDYMMDRLKTDAVFWKREDGARGSDWIEPTVADHDARARWGVDHGRN